LLRALHAVLTSIIIPHSDLRTNTLLVAGFSERLSPIAAVLILLLQPFQLTNVCNPQKKLYRDDKLPFSSTERSFHDEIALGSTEG